MAKRRNFTDQFKAKVVLEALRCDKIVQKIAAKHPLHLDGSARGNAGLLRAWRMCFLVANRTARPKQRSRNFTGMQSLIDTFPLLVDEALRSFVP